MQPHQPGNEASETQETGRCQLCGRLGRHQPPQFQHTQVLLHLFFLEKAIPPPVLSIGGVDLRRVDNTKYLGLSLSSDLSWSDHITNLCRKTKRLIGMLYRQFYAHADTPTLLKLYVAFIRPHCTSSMPVQSGLLPRRRTLLP